MAEDKPDAGPDLTQLARFAELIAAGYCAGRKAYDADVGTLVGAPSGWVIATYVDGVVRYSAIVALVIGPDCSLRKAITVEGYSLAWSAICDPASNRYIAMDGSKVYANKADWVAGMQALKAYEAAETAEATAH